MSLTDRAIEPRTDVPNPFDGEFWVRDAAEIDIDLAGLRAQGPMFLPEPDDEQSPIPAGPGAWLFTDYESIVHISRRPEIFSSSKGIGITDQPLGEDGEVQFNSIIGMDDPKHAKQRRVVSKGFTPRMLGRLNESVQAIATAIVDDIIDKGEVDFVVDVAARLPLKIVCDLMGIPEEKYQAVFDFTNVILGATDPEFMPEGEDIFTATLHASLGLVQIMEEVAESKKGGDGTDLTSVLLNAEADGDVLTHDELAGFFILLTVAGNETTRNALAWGLKLLTDHPDQRDLLLSDFETVIPSAVEEIVRVASPVTYMRRTATEDTEVNGATIREGDKVCMMYLAANRDESVFEDPLRFDVLRTPNNHLGFGGPGPHFCLGAHLARREITVMLRELFNRVPDLQAAGEPQLLRSSFIHGVKHLQASFTAGGSA